jgi:hypothetical protein
MLDRLSIAVGFNYLLEFLEPEEKCALRLSTRTFAVETYKMVTKHCDDKQKQVVWTAVFSSRCQSVQGGPGTGKSYALRCISRMYTLFAIPFKVLAATGTAAVNVNGATLHSHFDVNRDIPRRIFNKLKDKKLKYKYLIDESSMVSDQMLQSICFDLGGDVTESAAFNNASMTLFGDFRQLPPYQGKPIFHSVLLRHFQNTRLTHNHRQSDESFAASLDALGDGRITMGMLNILRIGQETYKKMDEEQGRRILHLFTSNKSKDQWNKKCQSQIKGPERSLDVRLARVIRVVKLSNAHRTKTCIASVFKLDEQQCAGLLAQLAARHDSVGDVVKSVRIKENFRIMVNKNIYGNTKNDDDDEDNLVFSNGTTGIVTGLNAGGGGVKLQVDGRKEQDVINEVATLEDLGEFNRRNVIKIFGSELVNSDGRVTSKSEYGWLKNYGVQHLRTQDGERCIVDHAQERVFGSVASPVWHVKSDMLMLDLRRIPLDVAFAITIYKAQGSTFHGPAAVKVDRLWPALGFVALSRFADADDVRVIAHDESVARINTDAAKFLKNGNLPQWPTQAQVDSFRGKHVLQSSDTGGNHKKQRRF